MIDAFGGEDRFRPPDPKPPPRLRPKKEAPDTETLDIFEEG